MGSSIPGLLEGTPVHNDGFTFGFQVVAHSAVSVGNLVTIGGDFAILPTSANTDFPLGVVYTSGQLSVDVGVAMRGILDVVLDASGSATAGDALIPSATVPGAMLSAGAATLASNRVIALIGGAASSVIQALFF